MPSHYEIPGLTEMFDRRPHRTEHNEDAGSADPCLYTIPDTSHASTGGNADGIDNRVSPSHGTPIEGYP